MSMRRGFFLLELIPILTVIVMLAGIVIFAINPQKNIYDAHNAQREYDLALLADAIHEYTRNRNRSLFLTIPLEPESAIEICAAVKTGSCTNLLLLAPLLGKELESIPLDPLATDVEHSRYFIVRTRSGRILLSAPDTEPLGDPDITISR